MKLIYKIPLTIILCLIALMSFIYPQKQINHYEVQIDKTVKQIKITENDGLKNLLEYVGLFALAFAVWQWKKELGFDSFAFFGKQQPVKPTDPDHRDNDLGDTPPNTPKPNLPTENYNYIKDNENLKKIINLISQNPNSLTNPNIISNRTGLSTKSVEKYLYELMAKQIVRKDTYPGSRSSVYSLVDSFDNKAIDKFIQSYIQKEVIYSDYRYVRLNNRIEIDGIIKTNKTNYIIETKFDRNNPERFIKNGINHLFKIEEEINLEPIQLILLLVTDIKHSELNEKFKYPKKKNLKIIVISADEITMPNTRL